MNFKDYIKKTYGTFEELKPNGSPSAIIEFLKESNYEGLISVGRMTGDHKTDNRKINISFGDITMKNMTIDELSEHVHEINVKAGWWTDLDTGKPKDRNVGELLCLVHSEVSEAMEGYRKNLMDDKLPHRKMFDVELADTIIRILDIAGKFNIPLGEIIQEKVEFNQKREDHKLENRTKDNGKKF